MSPGPSPSPGAGPRPRLRCFVGLGSNLGDRRETLRAAAEGLAELAGVELLGRSEIWETRPMGPGRGPFLNAAVELRASLEPAALLAQLLALESRHGRVRRERWGDRTLDLDLLCVFVERDEGRGEELRVAGPGLTLPHPGVLERDFVLRPLLDLAPGLRVGGRSCASALAELDEASRTLLAGRGRL